MPAFGAASIGKGQGYIDEIAAAWIACAEQAERKAQSATKNK
jgi:hypothetical protein